MEFILPGRSPHVSRKQAFELRIGQTGKVVTTIAEKNPGGERRNLNQTGNSQKWLKLNGKSPPLETTMGLCGKQVETPGFVPVTGQVPKIMDELTVGTRRSPKSIFPNCVRSRLPSLRPRGN